MALRATTTETGVTSFADDPRGFRGVNYSTDYGSTGGGTDYDILVDAAGGGDYTTLAAGVAAATSGQVVAVKGDGTKYREKVTLPSNITIQPYGTDRPEITGFENIGAGTLCTSPTDDGVLGSTLAGSGNVYKWTGLSLPTDFTNLLALNVRENGTPLYISTDRAETYQIGIDRNASARPYRIREASNKGDANCYHLADSYSSGTITDASVINSSNYTNGQLTSARAVAHVSPNIVSYYTISSANVASNTITLSGSPGSLETGNPYAILNVARGMIAGTYMFVDNGTDYDLYVYPNSAANATGGNIEVSDRETVFELPTSTPTNITIQGLHISGASGDTPGSYHGAAIRRTSNGSTGSGITIRNNLISDCDCVGYQTSAVWILRCDDITVENNTFRDLPHQRGFWSNGSLVNVNDGLVRRNVFERVGFATCTWYRAVRPAMVHNYATNCGGKAHANMANHYTAGSDFLVWGNEFVWSTGYITWQSMSNPTLAFNFLATDQKKTSTLDNRVMVDQGGSGTGLCFNNTCPVVVDGTAADGHLAIDINNGSANWTVNNNVAHGVHPISELPGTPVEVKSNVVTHDGYAGSTAGNLDASDFDVTNTFDLTLANTHTDYANRDWSDAGNISSTTGQNMSSTVTTLKSTFSRVTSTDLDIDFKGNTVTWTDLRVGADWADAA